MTVAALAVVGPLATAAFAGGSDAKADAVATLQIDKANVEVRKAGKDAFKAAKDEQKLGEGDTIRTDATGKAEVQYDDTSYTRLDESTTFTIVSLTDDEGNRQVEGSLETGRTWNRAEGLTESDSFEQSGAGATAAVQGTAFLIECESVTLCRYVAADNVTELTGADGAFKELTPRDVCDSDTGHLCDQIGFLSEGDPLFDIVNEHLLRDLLEHGLGDGPFPTSVSAIVVVENGQVVSFTPNPANPEPPGPPAPVVGSPPVTVNSSTADTPGPGTTFLGQQAAVYAEDDGGVTAFVLNVEVPGGGHYTIVFLDLPDPNFGTLYAGSDPVALDQSYEPGQEFTFQAQQWEPTCEAATYAACFSAAPGTSYPEAPVPGPVAGAVQWSDSFTFEAISDEGVSSGPTPVEVVVVDDMCATGTESHDQTAIDVTPGCAS